MSTSALIRSHGAAIDRVMAISVIANGSSFDIKEDGREITVEETCMESDGRSRSASMSGDSNDYSLSVSLPSSDDVVAPIPSLSLLYPDTAPRSTWRPQLDAWMKKNHPTKLRQIAQIHCPWVHRRPSPPETVAMITPIGSSESLTSRSISSSAPSPPGYKSRRLSEMQYIQRQYNRHEDEDDDDSEEILGHLTTRSPRLPSPPESPKYGGNSQLLPSLTLEQYTNSLKRRCISCGSDQSPCWRPSWSASAGQLCNSCGLRYKKTGARCTSRKCKRIPAKGEWIAIKNAAVRVGGELIYKCLSCGGDVEVRG
jgi:hypothetical protein